MSDRLIYLSLLHCHGMLRLSDYILALYLSLYVDLSLGLGLRFVYQSCIRSMNLYMMQL